MRSLELLWDFTAPQGHVGLPQSSQREQATEQGDGERMKTGAWEIEMLKTKIKTNNNNNNK